MIPTFVLKMWLLGLLSLGLVASAVYCAHEAQQRSWTWDPELQRSVFRPQFGSGDETWLYVAALALIIITLFGCNLVKMILRLTKGGSNAVARDPRHSPKPVSEERITGADGTELAVKIYGRSQTQAPTIVLSHGWGLDSAEWNYLVEELSDRFHIIVWDEAGLGDSTRPPHRDYSLENLARHLEEVLEVADGRPAVLLGHSIGGMIILTFCRLFPEALGNTVSGLVLTHTTPTDPVRTTSGAAFYTAIEKPVIVPLMHLTIALSPLVWLMNWLSYRNGSAHLSTKFTSFGGTETWQQLDFATRFQVRASPAVLARGLLGMMRYDARDILPKISVPTLVVSGDRDPVTKPVASAMISSHIPNSRLATLAPARHLGLIEHHAHYASTVAEFAQGIATSGTPAAPAAVLDSARAQPL
jgi:pimeloyl-ACP methyl ester carboxylesterase